MSYTSRGDNRRGRGSRGGGYGGGEKKRGSGTRGGHRYRSETPPNQKTPIILAKPHHDRGISNQLADQESNASKTSERRQVLARKDSLQPDRSDESPKPVSTTSNRDSNKVEKIKLGHESFVPPRNVKLIDDNQYCEALLDYVTDNPDFVVIGVVGTQSVGKSSILNSLIKSKEPENTENEDGQQNGSNAPQRMFRVQTFEKQMLSEHCTNGVNAWISPERILYLDSQPLFSNSVLDRSAQLEKKYSFEFSGAENTAEVHSMQLIGLFMSICHIVLIVQEGPICDTELLERIRIADHLRPSLIASRSFDEPDKVCEYAPEVVFVHNKVRSSEINERGYARIRKEYASLLDNHHLNFRYKTGLSGDQSTPDKVNLVLVPDLEDNSNSDTSFTSEVQKIKEMFHKLRIQPFLNNCKQNEKLWLQHAKKSWDQVKESSFYLEYSRLLRQK